MSVAQLDQPTFCKNNRITEADWQKASFAWDDLKAIGLDHEAQTAQLEECAELVAKTIRRCEAVHSVRWRVKKTESVMAKVIRKRAEGKDKYAGIGLENYHTLLTDLVGVRSLHLYKDDCFAIDEHIRRQFAFHEDPVAYVRNGDNPNTSERYTSAGMRVETHPAGYRSVHYVLKSQPYTRLVFMEVQVRTVFEEAWSEIDHRVRYPNFTDNELVEFFLGIFNRTAGSADEMATFVRDLAAETDAQAERLDQARREYVAQIAGLLTTIEGLTAENANVKEQAKVLQEQVARLKAPVAKSVGVLPSADPLAKAFESLATPRDAYGSKVAGVIAAMNAALRPSGYTSAMASAVASLTQSIRIPVDLGPRLAAAANTATPISGDHNTQTSAPSPTGAEAESKVDSPTQDDKQE